MCVVVIILMKEKILRFDEFFCWKYFVQINANENLFTSSKFAIVKARIRVSRLVVENTHRTTEKIRRNGSKYKRVLATLTPYDYKKK